MDDPVFMDLALIGAFHNIQELWLSETNISERGLYTLIRSCPFLESLRIDVSMPIVDQMCRAIGQCTELQKLHMTRSEKVTSRGIKSIAEGCLNLKEWNLSFTELSSNGFKTLAKYLPPFIQTLRICGRNTLTDDHVALLVQKCPNLRNIKIHMSSSVTAHAIKAICQLQHLELLSVHTCPNVPLAAFRGLVGLKPFKRLSINGIAKYQMCELQDINALMPGIEITSLIM